ncbi:unnamed protein product [Linum trigynum]|uniref:Uncharacterized protein n=1 Tax=Linum trigynum TaxID=586398 RepID=A0AAV2F6A0_9ROSI
MEIAVENKDGELKAKTVVGKSKITAAILEAEGTNFVKKLVGEMECFLSTITTTVYINCKEDRGRASRIATMKSAPEPLAPKGQNGSVGRSRPQGERSRSRTSYFLAANFSVL